MSQFNLHPRLAAKTLAALVLSDILCLALFGLPGICGTVGGLIPTCLPTLARSYAAVYVAMAICVVSFLGTAAAALWLALAGLFVLVRRRQPLVG